MLDLPDGRSIKVGPAHHFRDLVHRVKLESRIAGIDPPTPGEIQHHICQRTGFEGCIPVEGLSDDPGRPVLLPDRVYPKPDRYGPHLWGPLHMLGTRFRRDLFDAVCEMITLFLTDGRLGCVICEEHWLGFNHRYPRAKVTCAGECAVWSWKCHNLANQNKGARTVPFLSAASRYGWAPMTPHEIEGTLTKLSR